MINLSTSFSLGPLTVPLVYVVLAACLVVAVLVARIPLRRYHHLRARVTERLLDAILVFVVAWKLTPAIIHPALLVRDPLPLLMAAPGIPGAALGGAAALAWIAFSLFRRRRLRRAAFLPVLLFAGVVAVGATMTQIGSGIRPPGPAAPGLMLASLDGPALSLSSYRGHVVVVNFWATWCPPCRAELPDLVAFARRQGPDGAVLLGVDLTNTERSVDAVRAYAEEHGMDFTVLLDVIGAGAAAWGVQAYPTTFVLDPEGRVCVRRVGAVDASWLRRETRIACRQR
jgi:thiol-disulfide isomerase/thioredoxin